MSASKEEDRREGRSKDSEYWRERDYWIRQFLLHPEQFVGGKPLRKFQYYIDGNMLATKPLHKSARGPDRAKVGVWNDGVLTLYNTDRPLGKETLRLATHLGIEAKVVTTTHHVTEDSATERCIVEPFSSYQVSVEEYITFRRQGFLVVRGLVSPEEVAELRQHTEDLMQGRLPEQTGTLDLGDHESGVATQTLAAPPEHLSPAEKAEYFLRIHMLHRQLELHERYLLHPGILDVLQALIGPDVLALQTMLFLKGPGKPGQGWHQDSYYIPTHPDSLCGAWIAIDDCDELNGAMWFATGSQHEPVYPPAKGGGFGDRQLSDIHGVKGVSNPNDEKNELSRIADRYPHLLVPAKAGDVVFFGGHVLHRSKKNWTTDRFRRSFVGHYCNARSFTQWNDGDGSDSDPDTLMANHRHILARGDTHLPFAKPRFGTPCAALLPREERRRESEFAAMMMGDMDTGMMGATDADPNLVDDD